MAYINKVVLDFSFPYHEKNTALSKAKKIFYDTAIKKIDEILSATDNNIFIEKLEIDIGSATEEEFSEKFSAALLKALPATFFQKQNITKTEFIATDEKESLLVDDVVFYLINGYWQFPFQQKDEKELSKLVIKFIENRTLVFLLLNEIRSNNEINLKRITNLFTYIKTTDRFLYFVLMDFHPYLKETNSFFQLVYFKIFQGKTEFYEAFLHQLYKSKRLENLDDFKKFIIDFLQKHVTSTKQISVANSGAINKLQQILQNNKSGIKEILPLVEKIMSQKNVFADSVFDDKKEANKSSFILASENNKISINNAGLVLLHPYLSYLFAELKLIDDTKSFTDKNAQQKAVLFLQYLINNKRKQQEHLLVLNKILCGWPVEMPLKIKHQFTVEEKKVGAEMLDSFIEHWSVLRNTSRKGLVESFIKRKGLVQKTNNDFTVQVEKNSIDILLDSLPFGIRTIKLPWNEYIIYTEWAL